MISFVDPRVAHLIDTGWVGESEVEAPAEVVATLPASTYSHVNFPAGSTALNALTIPDNAAFSAPAQLDIRFAIERFGSNPIARTVLGHYDFVGEQRSWAVRINPAGQIETLLSNNGTVAGRTVVTCDVPLNSGGALVALGRLTWRNSDGRVQFFRKPPGRNISASLTSHSGWTQIGTDETGPTVLHNSTAPLTIGNLSSTVLSEPFIGNIHAVNVANTIGGSAVFALLPDDIPADTSTASFGVSTGQMVSVTRATGSPSLALVYQAIAPGIRVSPHPDPVVGLYYANSTTTTKPIIAAYYAIDAHTAIQMPVP